MLQTGHAVSWEGRGTRKDFVIRAGTHGTTDVDGQTLILGVPLLVKCCKRGMPYLGKGGEPGRIL